MFNSELLGPMENAVDLSDNLVHDKRTCPGVDFDSSDSKPGLIDELSIEITDETDEAMLGAGLDESNSTEGTLPSTRSPSPPMIVETHDFPKPFVPSNEDEGNHSRIFPCRFTVDETSSAADEQSDEAWISSEQIDCMLYLSS
ncbi:unnamed protein product [Protopolystoma xenopodis]|uniref:Uncharacterized protein n=1 Tax=Protopolystoma xenopodis TaxID=117903 RepID=A0A3S5CKR8_9PLAT|nr:unnamed protein product [Protopolystoma xenopodis]